MAHSLITAGGAQDRLGPHHDALEKVVLESFKRWTMLGEQMPLIALPLGETERAQFLHAHMRFEAKQLFDNTQGVTPTDALEFFALIFEPDVLLRFKYLAHGPQNYPTAQQKLLARQQYTDDMMGALSLDGVSEPPTLLTCGYRVSADASKVEQVVIRRDLKGHPSWEYSIFGDTVGQVAEPQALPNMPTPQPARLKSKLVKPKSEEGESAG